MITRQQDILPDEPPYSAGLMRLMWKTVGTAGRRLAFLYAELTTNTPSFRTMSTRR